MTREIRITFAIVWVIGSISACALFISANTPTGSIGISVGTTATSTPLENTPVKLTSYAGPPDIYPQVSGSTNPAIYQDNISQNICNPNWSTSSERPPSNYTTALKIEQLKSYGNKDQKTADYEEDHLISLELGGNPTDPNNLWPEPYTTSISTGGAKTKDSVENYLHVQVCSGKISLAAAQQEISTDWYAVYTQMTNNLSHNYGSIEPDSSTNDPDDE